MSQQQTQQEKQDPFEQTHSRIYNYHQALKRLKKVSDKITLLRSRMGILDHKKAREQFIQDNQRGLEEERLREEGKKMNETIRRKLRLVKDRSLSEKMQRQMNNYTMRKMNWERVEQARRAITEERFQAHDKIKEMTALNEVRVRKEKDERLMSRRIHRMKMRKEEERSLQAIRSLRQSKLTKIHHSFEEDTSRLIEQVKARQKTLQHLEGSCSAKQSLSVKRSPYQKVKKIVYARRTPTVQTHLSKGELTSHLQGTSPDSTFNFVVLE